VDLSIHWKIFAETGHALQFRFYRTEMKLRMFRRCSPAEFFPVFPDEVLVELRYLPDDQMDVFYTVCLSNL
jgi:hypothetical protein